MEALLSAGAAFGAGRGEKSEMRSEGVNRQSRKAGGGDHSWENRHHRRGGATPCGWRGFGLNVAFIIMKLQTGLREVGLEFSDLPVDLRWQLSMWPM